MMQNYMLVALGGALGSMARFSVHSLVLVRIPGGFSLATILVNVVGSCVIGLVLAILQQPAQEIGVGNAVGSETASEAVRLFLVLGVLGGFTTFSAFSAETMLLIQSGYWIKASLSAILSVVICVVAAFAGFAAGQVLMR